LNDFFAKNRNETVKRKHDSNSDDDSADPNNNVTNVSEPVPLFLNGWKRNFNKKDIISACPVFFIWGYMYPFTFIFGGPIYPLTLHLGVQRK
jgi:hypothetical protein